MQATAKTWVVLGAVALAAGCVVQSVGPFYLQFAVVQRPDLDGRWAMLGDDGVPRKQTPWVFAGDKLTTYGESGRTGVLEAVYFKIDDMTFLDTTAGGDAETSGAGEWWALHVRGVHCVSRVDVVTNQLVLTPLNYDWLADSVKKGEVKLPFLPPRKDDLLLFTASSEQWMGFLKQYGRIEEAFPKKGQFVFTRLGAAEPK